MTTLHRDEDAAFLDAVQTPAESIVVYLLRFAGLRVCEAKGLRVRDVSLTRTPAYPFGQINVRVSKTDAGIRVIPVLPELRPQLEKWIEVQAARGRGGQDLPFLCTAGGRPMDDVYIQRVVKRVAARAGVRVQKPPPDKAGLNVSSVSPHTLRRTFGSDLINRGKPLNAVSKALGHSSTSITERAYASLENAAVAGMIL